MAEQQAAGRELFLTIDRLAEPDLIPILFGLDLMQDYTNLYTGTDFDDLKDIGPWLIKIPSLKSSAFSFLFDTPEQNWGWLASADKLELTALCTHWRERMLITEAERKALYRFQDNRVIAHHLANLMPKQRPLLMGPLHSLLCWHQDEWAVWDNPTPAVQNSPTSTPWLDIPEPRETRNAIRQHNLEQWLWEHPRCQGSCRLIGFTQIQSRGRYESCNATLCTRAKRSPAEKAAAASQPVCCQASPAGRHF